MRLCFFTTKNTCALFAILTNILDEVSPLLSALQWLTLHVIGYTILFQTKKQYETYQSYEMRKIKNQSDFTLFNVITYFNIFAFSFVEMMQIKGTLESTQTSIKILLLTQKTQLMKKKHTC